MSLGVPYKEFFSHTIRELKVYDDAHRLEIKERDFMNYVLGEYVFDAFSAIISGLFAKNKSDRLAYTDLRKEPVLSKIDEPPEPTEEDMQRAYEQYRMQRKIDKLNWDLAHMDMSRGK